MTARYTYPGFVARFYENGYHMGQTKYSATWEDALGLAQLEHQDFVCKSYTDLLGIGHRRVYGKLIGKSFPVRTISFSVVWVDEHGKDHYTY